MVKLRLKRMGSKFNAFYRIVAADARAPRDGRFIEEIGYYNPNSKELKIEVAKKDKWLSEGAVPTETVKALFRKFNNAGGNETNAIVVLPKKVKKPKKKEAPKVEAPKEEVKKDEAKKDEAPKEEAKKDEAPAKEKEQAPSETKDQAPVKETKE